MGVGWRGLTVVPLVAVLVGVPPAPIEQGGRATPVGPTREVAYTLRYARPGDGTVHLALAPHPALVGAHDLVMPRAVPMGYGEAPYDAFVEDVSATGPDGAGVPVARLEGPRWRIGAEGASIARVDYRVDVRRMERDILAASDASRVRDGYVSLLGYSVFAYVDGLDGVATRLSIDAPPGWPVVATLAPGATGPGVREVRAGDFYALADSQVMLGPGPRVRHVASAVPLTVVVYAEGEADDAAYAELADTALRRVAAWFGDVPCDHYTVIQELLAPVSPRHQYGFSMEHLDSSTYYLSRDAGLTAASGADDRARVLYNFAHHVTHAWIPKRAFGEGYFPFRWELAPVLDTIWFSEGFAQYAAIAAVGAGEPDPPAYRAQMVARRFREPLVAMPAFLRRMPLVELSRAASTRYSSDFRTGRTSFARGGLMAAEMDERIAARTGGAKGLRDALRGLMTWSRGSGRGFRIDELPAIFAEATGVDTRDILDRWLAPMPDRP